MESLKTQFSALSEKIAEQAWAQELKAKWEELPPEQRHVARLAGIFGSILLLAIAMISWWASVRGLENDYHSKRKVLAILESGTQELAQLKSALPPDAAAGADETSWSDYIRTTAARSGVDMQGFEVSEEKAGEDTAMTSESLIDITLKKTNVKKLVRLVFTLEHSGRPIKLRNLNVDTKQDPEGYLDATLSVSAFKIK